jgi:hypothetical protein
MVCPITDLPKQWEQESYVDEPGESMKAMGLTLAKEGFGQGERHFSRLRSGPPNRRH